MSPNNEVLKFFKNKRTVAIQVISLAAAVLLLFSALPLFTAGSDSQKAGFNSVVSLAVYMVSNRWINPNY